MTVALLFLTVTPPFAAAPGWPVAGVVGLALLLGAAVVWRKGKNGERR